MEFEFLKLFNDELFRYFLIGCNSFALFIWMFNLITANISHMDRLWAILPNVYASLFLYTSIHYNPLTNLNSKYSVLKSDNSSQARLILMLFLTSVWGIRLVYVFWRRGYYSWSHEDHRWEHVRAKLGYPERKLPFHLYNFILMAFIQNWILLGHSLPFWFIQTNTASNRIDMQQPINLLDWVMAGLFLFFLTFEIVGDEQQWNFQTAKYKWIEECKKSSEKEASTKYTQEQVEDFKRGFLVKGLYAYSRHPNYFGELFIWWTIYGFTISSQYTVLKENFEFQRLFNYCMFSPLIMTFLFPRSSKITEKISSSKYPAYKHYMSKVNQIIPSFKKYAPDKIE